MGIKIRATQLATSALVVLALLACKKKNKSDETKTTTTTTSQSGGLIAPQPSWFVHKASGTEFLAPDGWAQKHGKSSVAFFAPDHTAVIAVGSYDKTKDPSATIMVTARELGLTDLGFKHAAKPGSINGIPARTADGTCKSNGAPAEYGYATLTPGGPENLLLIYAVLKSAPPAREQEAVASFKSFKRI